MMSLSNVRSLPMTDQKVVIGEYAIDRAAETRAEDLMHKSYPELKILTTPEGKRQIPLQQLLILEQRIQEEKQETYKEGQQAGYQSGHEAGLKEGQAEARKVVASLSGMLGDLTRQRHKLLDQARNHILEMVTKISEKLTFTAASLDPKVTMAIITGAIDQLLDKSRIKVKVHPDHLPELEQNIDKFRGSDTLIKEFIIEGDSRVRVGGCFIETPAGDIDARLESMFDIIKKSILEGEDAVL